MSCECDTSVQCDECGHGLWVVVGTRRLPLEDGWWEAGWSGSVMAPRGLERLHTDTGYGDGSYLGGSAAYAMHTSHRFSQSLRT